ncbi:MAG: protein phosphatase 2C domain-containing protein [Armatimonadota bacterium]|nr:protein phosphatase 2C domain-containing protein [Armatimonadota bacterium]
MDEPRITITGLSDVGKVRDNQEDSWAVWEAPTGADRRLIGRLLIVADGIGGNRAGEVASALAVKTVQDEYLRSSGLPPSRLRAAIREANNKILEETEERPECRGMGTTVVAAAILGDQLTVAWVGDSRAYLLRGKDLLQLTRDHSGAARSGSRGGAGLSRSLGAAMTVDPDIRQIILQPGDRVMLCSDGLYNLVSTDEISRFGRGSVERWTHDLVQAALKRGAPDNVTVVAAHIERLPFAPHRHPEVASGEFLDGVRLVEQLGADRFYLWYRAQREDSQRLLCILRPELQADNELLLEIEEDEESLGRTLSPHLAAVENAEMEKSLAYVCLRLP